MRHLLDSSTKEDSPAHVRVFLEALTQRGVFQVLKTVVLTPDEVDAWWELSPRQRVIADLLRTKFTNKAIGRALSITADTVNDHLGGIRRHLKVRSRVQIALYAERMAHRMNNPGGANPVGPLFNAASQNSPASRSPLKSGRPSRHR